MNKQQLNHMENELVSSILQIPVEIDGFNHIIFNILNLIQFIDNAVCYSGLLDSKVQDLFKNKLLETIHKVELFIKEMIKKENLVHIMTNYCDNYRIFQNIIDELNEIMYNISLPATTSMNLQSSELDWQSMKFMMLSLQYFLNDERYDELDKFLNNMNKMLEYTNQNIPNLKPLPLLPYSDFYVSTIAPMIPIEKALLTDKKSIDKSEQMLENAHNLPLGQSFHMIYRGSMVCIRKLAPSDFLQGVYGIREASLLMRVSSEITQNSPYLSPILGMTVDRIDNSSVYFLSQLAPYGALSSLLLPIESTPNYQLITMTPKMKLSIMLDIASGVNHLHTYGIVHGRIKASNILLFEGYRAKLSDFGYNEYLTNNSRINLKGMHGFRWSPPEIVLQENQLELDSNAYKIANNGKVKTSSSSDFTQNSIKYLSVKCPYKLFATSDLYSLGLVGLCLLTQKLPFSNVLWEEGVKNQLLKGVTPSLPSVYNDKDELKSLEQFITPCLNNEPVLRTSISEILEIARMAYYNSQRMVILQESNNRINDYNLVKSDIEEISKKIKDFTQQVVRGKALINKKMAELPSVYNPIQKKEKENEILKLKEKLLKDEKELIGLQEDLHGAESDL
eukprot:gene8110-10985_t